MNTAVIVGAVRTAVGRKNGKLSGVRPDDLLALALKEVVARTKVDPNEVEDVVVGCVDQVGEQGFNIARNAALIAGFPLDVCGTTLDRMCGSGQQAANFCAMGVMAGQYDTVIAGGVENMTRVPMGSNGQGPGDGPISPKLQALYNIIPQGLSAELIAEKWGLKREELDEFSAQSHEKAGRAIAEGRFKREIVPVTLPDGSVFDTDEGVRVPVNREKVASLAPSFKTDGVITAANSSQISDGAAALLLMSEAKAKALGLKPRARVVATALAGVDPTIMLTGPIPATQRVLKKAGMTLDQIDLFEINEAFASVVLAWERELHPDMARVNVNGGAIALGHPLGCSGAKLMTTLLPQLERTGGRARGSAPDGGPGAGLAEGFLDRGVEIGGLHGLEQAAADTERGEAVVVLVAEPPAGDEQQRDPPVHGAQPLGELPAVPARHAEGGHHDVEPAGGVGLERRGAARAGGHGVAAAPRQPRP